MGLMLLASFVTLCVETLSRYRNETMLTKVSAPGGAQTSLTSSAKKGASQMNELARREFLKFIGAAATAASLPPIVEAQAASLWFTPVRIPSPLPIYKTSESWLATGLNGDGNDAASDRGAGAQEVQGHRRCDRAAGVRALHHLAMGRPRLPEQGRLLRVQ